MDLQLAGKVAIVTGSSRGFGFASAAALAAEGCLITICARGEARLEEAASALSRVAGPSGQPAHVLAVPADLSTQAGVEQVVSGTVEAFGGLDILVNNVGLARGATIVDTSDEEWRGGVGQDRVPA